MSTRSTLPSRDLSKSSKFIHIQQVVKATTKQEISEVEIVIQMQVLNKNFVVIPSL